MKNKLKLLNYALLSGLLVVIPAVFSLFLIIFVIDSQQALDHEAAAGRIEGQARDFLATLDAESLYAPGLRRLGRVLAPLTAEMTDEVGLTASISAAVKNFQTEAGHNLGIYLFNRNGKFVNTGLVPANNAPPLQYIWNCTVGAEVSNDYTGRKADVSEIFGRNFSVTRVSGCNDICFPTYNYGRHGLFYSYREHGARNGMIAFIEIPDDLTTTLVSRLRLIAAPDRPIILRSGNRILFGKEFYADPTSLFELAENCKTTFTADGRLWKKFTARNLDLLFGQSFAPAGYKLLKQTSIAIFAAIILTGLGLIYCLFSGAWAPRISIRYKLVAIFLFAVYLPVLGLFTLGYNGLRDHRTVLENQANKEIIDVLMEIDTGFSIKEREILATFDKFYHDRSWHNHLSGTWKEADLAIRKSLGIGKRGENFFNWLEVRDIEQNQLYSTSTGEANDRVKAMGKSMSLICLEKVMPQRLQKAGIKLKQSDLVLTSLLENPVLGFSHLFEQPGKMVEMEFEGMNTYWYWNYYPDEGTRVAYIGGNSKVQYNALDYLEKAMQKRFSLGNTAIRLVAHLPSSQLWIPGDIYGEDQLQSLFRFSSLNDKIATTKLEYGGQKYLAACMPGIKLKDFFVASLYPAGEIDARIAGMWLQINLGVAFILIIAALTGMLLSKAFLQPISELSLGLRALRKRDIHFRVDIGSHDELGILGRTFNLMMAEVEEMLIAGSVQHCLIPATLPQFAGYESLVFNRMAADVGGDYADMFDLPDNRRLIVIGDVTGHGVSSAILTAMVKASVFRFAVRDTDLQTMLRKLSEMIFELLQRRKLMTFCAIILDCGSGRFISANAGHPFPLIFDADGNTRQQELAALPLGTSPKRSHYKTSEGCLGINEMLLLYTDGIVESQSPAGEEFGLTRMQQLICNNRSSSLEKIRDSLLSAFQDHYQREELEDDLTLIMIRRQAHGIESPV